MMKKFIITLVFDNLTSPYLKLPKRLKIISNLPLKSSMFQLNCLRR
jgi:hypothetical protein